MEKLKPCPFCGGPAKMKHADHCSPWDGVTGAEGWAVSCSEPWCPGHNTQVYHVSKGNAVNVWNIRLACDDCQMGGVPATEENMAKYGWVKERTCRMAYYEPCSGDEYYPTECYTCSECKNTVFTGKPRYCPHCGAKVVEP